MRATLKAATLVAGGSAAVALVLTPMASADNGQSGNTTCEAEGFLPPPPTDDWDDTGKINSNEGISNQYVETTVYDDEGVQTLDVVDINLDDDFVIAAVIVKAGSAAQGDEGGSIVYTETFTGLTAPGGKDISHYSICTDEEPTPTPTQTTTSPAPSPTTTSPEPTPTQTTTSPAPSPTTTSPEPTVEPTTTIPPGEELPDTGTNSAVPMTVAAVLGLAGGGALLLRRRLMS